MSISSINSSLAIIVKQPNTPKPGPVILHTSSITDNDDGTFSVSAQTRTAGSSTSRSSTITKGTDGTTSVEGSFTKTDGSVLTYSGSRTKTDTGVDSQFTLTKADGSTVNFSRHRDVTPAPSSPTDPVEDPSTTPVDITV